MKRGKRTGRPSKKARSLAARKGWESRRKSAHKRSLAAKKGWETRRSKLTDESSILAELADRTSVFGEIEEQKFDEDTHHGATWHTYTVGLSDSLDFSLIYSVFRVWRPVLSNTYRKATILRGRLLSFDGEAKMRAGWYTLATTEKFRDSFTQLKAELREWSARTGPSHAAEGCDGFEIQLEVSSHATRTKPARDKRDVGHRNRKVGSIRPRRRPRKRR